MTKHPMSRVITEEQKEAIRRKLTGRKLSQEHKDKIRAWAQANKDKCRPPEAHIEKLRQLYKGRPFSGKTFSHKGRKQSLAERMRRRLSCRRGVDHPNWNGGGSGRRSNDVQYVLWRTLVFERDNYTCLDCGKRGYLTAHHKKPWRDFPELRYEVSNGVTLCPECHGRVDPFFRRLGQAKMALDRRYLRLS